jgi:hypothetical protein
MDRILLLVLSPLLFGFLTGCSTVDSRIQQNPQTFASLSPAQQALVRRGGIREGMSTAAVYLAWGRPDRVRQGSRAGVPFEAWIYTTTRSEFVSGCYPGFYGYGNYRSGWRGHSMGDTVFMATTGSVLTSSRTSSTMRSPTRLHSSRETAAPAGSTVAEQFG